jgi:hypothetical protein
MDPSWIQECSAVFINIYLPFVLVSEQHNKTRDYDSEILWVLGAGLAQAA